MRIMQKNGHARNAGRLCWNLAEIAAAGWRSVFVSCWMRQKRREVGWPAYWSFEKSVPEFFCLGPHSAFSTSPRPPVLGTVVARTPQTIWPFDYISRTGEHIEKISRGEADIRELAEGRVGGIRRKKERKKDWACKREKERKRKRWTWRSRYWFSASPGDHRPTRAAGSVYSREKLLSSSSLLLFVFPPSSALLLFLLAPARPSPSLSLSRAAVRVLFNSPLLPSFFPFFLLLHPLFFVFKERERGRWTICERPPSTTPQYLTACSDFLPPKSYCLYRLEATHSSSRVHRTQLLLLSYTLSFFPFTLGSLSLFLLYIFASGPLSFFSPSPAATPLQPLKSNNNPLFSPPPPLYRHLLFFSLFWLHHSDNFEMSNRI